MAKYLMKHLVFSILYKIKSSDLKCAIFIQKLLNLLFLTIDIYRILTFYKKKFGKSPNFIRPIKFSEFLQYRKIFKNEKQLAYLADKLHVRFYVIPRTDKKFMPRVYWVGTDIRDAKYLDLPKKFIIKANHSCGVIMFVDQEKEINWEQIYITTSAWLKRDMSFWHAERHYRWITPKIFIEEEIEPYPGETTPRDCKFFVFYGAIRAVKFFRNRQFSTEGNISREQSLYLVNPLPFEQLPDDIIMKMPYSSDKKKSYLELEIQESQLPDSWNEMCSKVNMLADPTEPFVRIDLYDNDKQVMFSEFTFTPFSGFQIFNPTWLDDYFGYLISKNCKKSKSQLNFRG
ncbi:MAG: ATP-grasp fold amidoligase family protein [bacterium]